MRVERWRRALGDELWAARKREWKWGEHDCVTMAARCADAVTGGGFLGRLAKYVYEDARSAAALFGDGGLRALVTAEIGDPVHWSQCGAGDLVLCEHQESRAFNSIMTVHDGAQLLAPAERGIRRVPMEFALCGWKIE